VHLPEYSVTPGQILTTSIPGPGVLTIAHTDGPQFLTPDTVDVAENTTSILTVAAADASGGALTYSVSGGDDAASFVIDSFSGALSFVSVRDFENAIDTNRDGVYEVTIMADNGQGSSAIQPILVRVKDVDEVPPRVRIIPIASPNRSLPVDEIHVVFTEAVTGFDVADIQLMRSKDQTVAVPLASASLTTSDNVTWVFGGVSSLTAESGRYRLEIVNQGSGVVDLVGNQLNSGHVTTWTTGAGDANGDGQFNQFDIILVLQRGKYLSGQPANWSDGDWNGDGRFDQLDIVTAQQTFPSIYLRARSFAARGVEVTHERDVRGTSPSDRANPGLHPSLVDAALS
jgi:hypothetical protein